MRSLRTTLIAVGIGCLMVAAAVVGFGVTTSDAQTTQVTCPAGYILGADGETCLSDAVDDNVTTTTSCLQGVLSEDGTMCIVPRLDAAPAPSAGAGGGAGSTAPVPVFTG